MGETVDIEEFCNSLKATKPPYRCPIENCGKLYRSFTGMQYHMHNFIHGEVDNASSATSNKTGNSSKKKRVHHRSTSTPIPPKKSRPSPVRDMLTYAEAQRLVEVEIDHKMHRIDIYQPLKLESQDYKEDGNYREGIVFNREDLIVQEPKSSLPVASFEEVTDYVKTTKKHVTQLAFLRYMERTAEELDEEVEYDMDDQDHAWLTLVNNDRSKEGAGMISRETFEYIMDRFEKEAHFLHQSCGEDTGIHIDEDAVCSICMDGECQNSNVILFCDMCNLAVHQECYGVPYIPEGQWLCRRCLQSPSKAVSCCLCPNNGGAFKQTEDGRWAHVICAIWIPEVVFANTVFLEPVSGIQNIPAARWKLSCYICKQRSTGASIQCHRTNCYTAFHVTCAQQAGLHMKVECIQGDSNSKISAGSTIRKTAYCHLHVPTTDGKSTTAPQETSNDVAEKSKNNMRKARKLLAQQRNQVPFISIPVIPDARLDRITKKIHVAKKLDLMNKLVAFWTLKRKSRNGVSLLRRLQTSHVPKAGGKAPARTKQHSAAEAKLKFWRRLRQDLEKARLLVELIRKREKLKREELRTCSAIAECTLVPFRKFLSGVLQELRDIDTGGVFAMPVDISSVPDYFDYIKCPMDLSSMQEKVNQHGYASLEEFGKDMDLMISNCMTYNTKDTPFYKAALRLRDQGGAVLRAAQIMADGIGFDTNTGVLARKPTAQIKMLNDADTLSNETVDEFVEGLEKTNLPIEDRLRVLIGRADTAIIQNGRRSRVTKTLRKRISMLRRVLSQQRDSNGTEVPSTMEESSADDQCITQDMVSSPAGPVSDSMETEHSVSSGLKTATKRSLTPSSPGAVNRRTAILFASKKLARKSSPKTVPVVEPAASNKQDTGLSKGPSIPKLSLTRKPSTAADDPSVTRTTRMEESFLKYRGIVNSNLLSASEVDELSSSSTDDTGGSELEKDQIESSTSTSGTKRTSSTDDRYSVPLAALDLVWAKCRGYPWYPAMIIDPKIPKGYTFNGVPIPIPPEHVLAMRHKFEGLVFLVLFFDAKRTWQWLPRDKLEPLGLDSEYDRLKLSENKKANLKKAVMSAYEKALKHQRKIDDGDDEDQATLAGDNDSDKV